ncbi:MAG: hypothetical protein ACO1NV_10330 [Leptospira bouyouniensis]|uniref:Uncharacterized protein n=1 Tax=Leptospira bouyouniensis TaxID=2484911 RepID=A0A7I0HM40_9LEPT|nr:hypothetical protein [Leptospira bouyouniensis]TGK48713.1 hypothetical protein EHQ10_13495 [Leptospira bouyouniensis]TGL02198.1 hypothetical protein EHQ43_17725 [Leptospira bouyouniensis]TGM81084.1 hypothetical protein EHQ99_15760 [Leptospira bouyouniensis]
MTNFYRFPLVLIALFVLANVVFCQWNHRETQEGVYRMDDSVIRYVESLEEAEKSQVTRKPSPFGQGIL